MKKRDRRKKRRRPEKTVVGQRTANGGFPPHADVGTPIARRYRSLYLSIAITLRPVRLGTMKGEELFYAPKELFNCDWVLSSVGQTLKQGIFIHASERIYIEPPGLPNVSFK